MIERRHSRISSTSAAAEADQMHYGGRPPSASCLRWRLGDAVSASCLAGSRRGSDRAKLRPVFVGHWNRLSAVDADLIKGPNLSGGLFVAPDQLPDILAGVAIGAGTQSLINHVAQGFGERDVHGWTFCAHAIIVGRWQSLSTRLPQLLVAAPGWFGVGRSAGHHRFSLRAEQRLFCREPARAGGKGVAR